MKNLIVLSACCVAVVWSLDGEVKQNFTNPSIATQEYDSSSDDHVEINCANSQTMANSSFADWIKIWHVNGSEEFDVSFLTFVNKNSTLLFNQVSEKNAGHYECCYHVYAYEDFVCSSTELIVDNSLPATTESIFIEEETTNGETNVSTFAASVQEDAWNVNLTDADFLNCQPNNSYFIRLFSQNVSTLDCVLEANSSYALQTLCDFPSPLNTDVFILDYNPDIHDGVYICNASLEYENNTVYFSSTFTVRESNDTNIHSEFLPYELVAPYLNTSYSPIVTQFVVMLIFLLCICVL